MGARGQKRQRGWFPEVTCPPPTQGQVQTGHHIQALPSCRSYMAGASRSHVCKSWGAACPLPQSDLELVVWCSHGVLRRPARASVWVGGEVEV